MTPILKYGFCQILPNQTSQTKPTKQNLPNQIPKQTCQSKPIKPNQTQPTKLTEPNLTNQTKLKLLVKAIWQCLAFDVPFMITPPPLFIYEICTTHIIQSLLGNDKYLHDTDLQLRFALLIETGNKSKHTKKYLKQERMYTVFLLMSKQASKS